MSIDKFRDGLEKSRAFWQESADSDRRHAQLSRVCALGADVIALTGVATTFVAPHMGFGITVIGVTGDVLCRKLAAEEERDALACELTAVQRQAELDQLEEN